VRSKLRPDWFKTLDEDDLKRVTGEN